MLKLAPKKKEKEMATLRVLCSRGDGAVQWDLKRVEKGDEEALAAIKEAERIFEEERVRGSTAFKTAPGTLAVRIDEFDRTAEEITIIPRIKGG